MLCAFSNPAEIIKVQTFMLCEKRIPISLLHLAKNWPPYTSSRFLIKGKLWIKLGSKLRVFFFFLFPFKTEERLKLTFLEVTFTSLHFRRLQTLTISALLGIYTFLVVHLDKATPESTEPISIGDKLRKPVQSFVEIEWQDSRWSIKKPSYAAIQEISVMCPSWNVFQKALNPSTFTLKRNIVSLAYSLLSIQFWPTEIKEKMKTKLVMSIYEQ